MADDASLNEDIELLLTALHAYSPELVETQERAATAVEDKEAAYQQLYRYAGDIQRLIAERSESSQVEEEKNSAYRQLESYGRDFQKLLKQREDAYDALARAHIDTLRRLVAAAEYKDDDTGVHIVRMSNFSALIARALGEDDAYCSLLLQASPMHDIGKIGVPDSILKKPGKLTDEEWVVMRKHPEYGAKILQGSDVPVLQLAAEVALAHHEKFDGSGYPAGLKGEAIPQSGRIVALADFFDAVTMDRVYRPAFPDDKAFEMVREGEGTHFDPKVVEAFFSVADEIVKTRDQINREIESQLEAGA